MIDADGRSIALTVTLGILLGIALSGGLLTATATDGLGPTAIENKTATLEIPNTGESYSVGFPLPVNGTLGDTFVNGTEGIGAVFTYDDGWVLREDFASMSPDSRDAIAVTTTGMGPETIQMEVEYVDTSGGVIGNPEPGTRPVERGWNFISGQNCENAESSFRTNVLDDMTQQYPRLVIDPFYGPFSPDRTPVGSFSAYVMGSYQWGVTPPAVDPFKGYFSYYTGSSEVYALEDPDLLCSN